MLLSSLFSLSTLLLVAGFFDVALGNVWVHTRYHDTDLYDCPNTGHCNNSTIIEEPGTAIHVGCEHVDELGNKMLKNTGDGKYVREAYIQPPDPRDDFVGASHYDALSECRVELAYTIGDDRYVDEGPAGECRVLEKYDGSNLRAIGTVEIDKNWDSATVVFCKFYRDEACRKEILGYRLSQKVPTRQIPPEVGMDMTTYSCH